MSEINKLYENAGCEKNFCHCKNKCPYFRKQCNDCEMMTYPPFTAEKQIELIKWLAKTRPIHISFLIDKWVIEGMVRYGKKYDTFEDALSGYINNLWQDLTPEEKQQVKGILE